MNATSLIHRSEQERDLFEKVSKIVKAEGLGLRDLEVLGSARSPLVRVTLDAKGLEGQIGIEDCVRVHEILSPVFDVWDPFPAAYTLEVSSPGEKPILRSLGHFEEAVGSRVEIETLEAIPMPQPMKPRKRFVGALEAVEPALAGDAAAVAAVTVRDDVGVYKINLSQIRSAHWLREYSIK